MGSEKIYAVSFQNTEIHTENVWNDGFNSTSKKELTFVLQWIDNEWEAPESKTALVRISSRWSNVFIK